MKKLSHQSQNYLASYKHWLRLFPRSFREHFEQEMLLLLHDQLSAVEEHGDRSQLREVYLSALTELPFTALKERLLSPVDLTYYFEKAGLTSWRAFSYFYFLMIGLILVSGTMDTGLLAVIGII